MTVLRRLLAGLRWQGITAFGFNLGLGIALTVLLTAPAVLLLDSHIVGYPHDGFAYIWKMWWTRKALLDLPLWEYRCERYQLYYAAIHGHRIVGGLVTHRAQEAEAAMREVESLVQLSGGAEPAESLAELGIRYVVLHKLCLEDEELGVQTAFLAEQLGDLIYDDRWIRAFEVPGNPEIEP